MAVHGKLELKGLDEYLEKLASAGEDVDAAAGRALAAGGEVALAGMLKRVPRDTEHLAASLSLSEPQKDGNYNFVMVGLGKDVDGDTVRYGSAQEYGTSSMAAQPFVRPTMDNDGSKIRKAMKTSLEQEGLL